MGNATRARFVTALARSGEHGLSLVLVDKEQLPPGTWTCLPFVRTLGLRGHDLSGVEFHGAPLPGDAVVGAPGIGMTQVLKTLQITRTAIAALSFGTMDAALRIGLGYTTGRRLHGDTVFVIPVIRHQLVREYVNLFIGECTAPPVARALVLAPERLSLWSSVVKYLVPVIAEETAQHVGVEMGARSYLREGVAHGVFQKLQRDHAIAGAATSCWGMTVTARRTPMALRTPCMVSNVLPLRLDVAPGTTIVDLARLVRQETHRLARHQRYNQEYLRRDLGYVDSGRRLHGPEVNVLPIDQRLDFAGTPGTLRYLAYGPVEDISFTAHAGAGQDIFLDFAANSRCYTADDLALHAERVPYFLTSWSGWRRTPAARSRTWTSSSPPNAGVCWSSGTPRRSPSRTRTSSGGCGRSLHGGGGHHDPGGRAVLHARRARGVEQRRARHRPARDAGLPLVHRQRRGPAAATRGCTSWTTRCGRCRSACRASCTSRAWESDAGT